MYFEDVGQVVTSWRKRKQKVILNQSALIGLRIKLLCGSATFFTISTGAHEHHITENTCRKNIKKICAQAVPMNDQHALLDSTLNTYPECRAPLANIVTTSPTPAGEPRHMQLGVCQADIQHTVRPV